MPYFTHPMKNKEVNLGDTAVINCNANGTPEPTIKWLKDGGPINMTERHFFTLGNKMMIIVDTLPSDAGTYQCQLNNSLGHENGYSHLKVNSSKKPPFLCGSKYSLDSFQTSSTLATCGAL